MYTSYILVVTILKCVPKWSKWSLFLSPCRSIPHCWRSIIKAFNLFQSMRMTSWNWVSRLTRIWLVERTELCIYCSVTIRRKPDRSDTAVRPYKALPNITFGSCPSFVLVSIPSITDCIAPIK